MDSLVLEGSGKKTSIRKIVEIINNNIPNGPLEIKWDVSKPAGDKIRLMNIEMMDLTIL